jgi:hypothetical protein
VVLGSDNDNYRHLVDEPVTPESAPSTRATEHPELRQHIGEACVDGSEVERYLLEGKIREIADYCETDIVNTYRVWLRYEFFAVSSRRYSFNSASRSSENSSRRAEIQAAFRRLGRAASDVIGVSDLGQGEASLDLVCARDQ